MELHLIILSFGLTIVALSLIFFLHAITSVTYFKKSLNSNLYFLYCICLFIIGITMLSISVNPENEQSLIEKFKNIIYNVNDNYSPNNQENEDNKEDNKEDNNLNDNYDIDDNENNENNENIDNNDNHKKNENNKEKNDNKRNNEMNDIEIKGENFNDNNNIYDDEKIDNNYNKEFNDPLNNKDIKERKNQYIIRNASFNPGKFIIFNFAKFWIKFANFLKFCGRKVVKLILFNKKE